MSSLAQPRRFAFDTVFDDGGRIAYAPPPAKRTIASEELEAMRARAYAEGEQSALALARQAEAAALARIADATAAALSTLAAAAHEHRSGAAELALAAARKIADAALDRFPEAPLTAALEALSREVEGAPRLVVQVSAPEADELRAKVEAAAAQAGFEGRLSLTTDFAAPAGAFTFDWGDGRAAFDPDAAAARVAEALHAALAAEGLHAEALPPVPGDLT